MASHRLLIISGTLLAVSILSFSDPIPSPYESRFLECERKAREAKRNFEICCERDINNEAINETIRIFGNSNCSTCTHLCRKKDEVSKCYWKMTEEIATLSNKSVVMMPFLRNIFDETYSAVCENDAEIMRVIAAPDSRMCMRDQLKACSPQLAALDDIDKLFFCNYKDPADDKLTSELFCQKILSALECIKGISGNCPDFHRTAISLENKLRNSNSCSKYY
ncbi:uncharacterized protein LOC124174132 [Ischnura elegans]|uniref:uncharacterized protein LOC124174132 n=1 Tax=Ischnura elegans TaxID=197161 RepID=UPI001ED882E5|nr:uncharacterized protein LOC124174132 [Ischnura elegans]